MSVAFPVLSLRHAARTPIAFCHSQGDLHASATVSLRVSRQPRLERSLLAAKRHVEALC